VGSAGAVQANLNSHEADFTNPHAVTAAQAGADPAGSAAAVQANLNSHEADFTNPHQVTAAQLGATALTVSDTPPVAPLPGDQWYRSAIGAQYIWYEDADSAQWVQNGPSGAAV